MIELFFSRGRRSAFASPHLKSMVPLLLVSNVLKMLLLKLSALPLGKILEYISTNWSLVSSPLGQSARNPSYHSCTHKCQVSGVKCVKYARNRCRASFKCQVSSLRCQVSSLRCQMSSVRCQMLSVKKCHTVLLNSDPEKKKLLHPKSIPTSQCYYCTLISNNFEIFCKKLLEIKP